MLRVCGVRLGGASKDVDAVESEVSSCIAFSGACVDRLEQHRHDKRPAVYTAEQLEAARTGDPYWNAAQEEMIHTGMIHNYMRMYWCKQVSGSIR